MVSASSATPAASAASAASATSASASPSASALLLPLILLCDREAKPRPFLACSVLVCSVMFCSCLFSSVLLCSIVFFSLLFYSVSVCPGVETMWGRLSSLRRASRSLLRQVFPEAPEAWYIMFS